MPKWFKYDSDSSNNSDSDSDSSSSIDSSSISASSSPLNISKWLKGAKDSDSSDNGDRGNLLSKEQKRTNIINDISFNTSNSMESHNWIEFYNNILKIKDYIKKEGKIHTEFMKVINLIQTNILDNYIEFKETVNSVDLDIFKKSIKIVNQLIEEYKYTINLYNNNNITDCILVTPIISEESLLQEDIQKILVSKTPLNEIGMLVDRCKDYIDLYIQAISIYIARYIETRHLSFSECKVVYETICDALDILDKNPHIVIREPSNKVDEQTIPFYISLSYAVCSLKRHYKYLLQNTEVKSEEYCTLQKWEVQLVKLCNRIYNFYTKSKPSDKHIKMANVLNCILNLTYHTTPYNPVILKYQKIIQKYSNDDKIISESILYTGLHLIINKRYNESLELVRNSYRTMEDDYYIYTPELSILYNQFLARVGIVAFEQRCIEDSFMALSELCQDKNLDILLGQVTYEKQFHLLIPFHKHVDTTVMMECFLICCVLIDITPLPMPFSKLYTSITYKCNKEGVFQDTTFLEEIVYLAAKCIKSGKWQEGYDLLEKIPSFEHIKNHVGNL